MCYWWDSFWVMCLVGRKAWVKVLWRTCLWIFEIHHKFLPSRRNISFEYSMRINTFCKYWRYLCLRLKLLPAKTRLVWDSARWDWIISGLIRMIYYIRRGNAWVSCSLYWSQIDLMAFEVYIKSFEQVYCTVFSYPATKDETKIILLFCGWKIGSKIITIFHNNPLLNLRETKNIFVKLSSWSVAVSWTYLPRG